LTGLSRRADGLVTTSCVHYNLNKEIFHVTWGGGLPRRLLKNKES